MCILSATKEDTLQEARVRRSVRLSLVSSILSSFLFVLLSGCGLFGSLNRPNPVPEIAITANPTSIAAGASSTLTVTVANATQVTVTGTDGSTYTLPVTGGTQAVTPKATTTYTAVATRAGQATHRECVGHRDGYTACRAHRHHHGRSHLDRLREIRPL